MSEYTQRRSLPTLVAKGKSETALLPVYLDGSVVSPVSGVYTLYTDTNELVVSGPVTVVSNVATYTVTGPDTEDRQYSTDWREEWELTFEGGIVKTFVVDVYLVRRKVYPAVCDEDLYRLHPELRRLRSRDLASYQSYIDEGWEGTVCPMLIEKGLYPHKIVDTWKLRGALLAEVMRLVCMSFITRTEGEDRWELLAKHYASLFESRFGALTFKLDHDEDGHGEHTDAAEPVVFLSSSPRGRRGRGIGEG